MFVETESQDTVVENMTDFNSKNECSKGTVLCPVACNAHSLPSLHPLPYQGMGLYLITAMYSTL